MSDPHSLPSDIATPLRLYRVMAYVVGVLLAVLFLVGVPLANFDGSPMWEVPWSGQPLFGATPAWVTPGSSTQGVGEFITEKLGVAHGWLYMIFLLAAFRLARRALWPIGFTLVTLVCGTVPLLSFWAEHRATRRVLTEYAGLGDGDAVLEG